MDQRGESSHGSVTDEKKAAGEHVLGVDEYESEMPDMYAFLYCVRRDFAHVRAPAAQSRSLPTQTRWSRPTSSPSGAYRPVQCSPLTHTAAELLLSAALWELSVSICSTTVFLNGTNVPPSRRFQHLPRSQNGLHIRPSGERISSLVQSFSGR